MTVVPETAFFDISVDFALATLEVAKHRFTFQGSKA